MIKKILLTLGLCLFGFIGFSSSWKYDLVGAVYPSVYDNNYDIGVLTKGTLITQSLGYGRAIFLAKGGEGGSFFYWSKNGLPYIYDELYWDSGTRHVYEGYLKAYKICDIISSSSDINSGPSNCGNYIDLSDISSLDNFFSSINTSVDYYGYNKFGGWSSLEHSFSVCFSSEAFGKSVCFIGGMNDYSYGETLTGSLDYAQFRDNIGISTIPDSEIGTSPGVGGGSGGSSGDDIWYSVSPDLTNSNVWLGLQERNGFFGNVCYGGYSLSDIFNSGDFDSSGYENFSGASLFDIYNSYSDNGESILHFYEQYRYFYNAGFNLYFQGKSKALYSLINQWKIQSEWSNTEDIGSIIEYCRLDIGMKNGTISGDTIYTGDIKYGETGLQGYNEWVLSKYNNPAYYTSGTSLGDILVFTGENVFNKDLSIYNRSDGSFKDMSSSFVNSLGKLSGDYVGIIPSYIVYFLLAIIFIRFLRR